MDVTSYFCLFIDESGVFHISPRNNIEAMALKHLKYEIGEHTMEKMVVIDTQVPIRLGSEK